VASATPSPRFSLGFEVEHVVLGNMSHERGTL